MKEFFFTRKLFLFLLNLFSVLIIFLIILSTTLLTFPNKSAQVIDKIIFQDHEIIYSEISSKGLFRTKVSLNDLRILDSNQIQFDANTIEIDLNILNLLLPNKSFIKGVKIDGGNIYSLNNENISSESLGINSNIILNKNSLLDGYIHFIHKEQMGSVYFSSIKNNQRFLVSLPFSDWISIAKQERIKQTRFSINLVGGVKDDFLNSIGSFELNEKGYGLNNLNGNFVQSYKNNVAFISFSDLTKPLLDKKNILSIDFSKKIIRLSSLYLDKNYVDLNFINNINKIYLKNLTYLYDNKLFFSSSFNNLNLQNVYLDSVKNISGTILGNRDLLQFKIEPDQVQIKANDGTSFSMIAHGTSYYNFANQELRTELLFEDNKTKVELQMLNNSSGAFNIDLIAKDITTNLFVALFPETLESIKSNLKASIKSNWIDDLIFSISYGHDEASLNYMNGSINTNEFLYQIDSDQLVKAKTVDLNLKDRHIALSLNNGFYNNTPFNNAKVLINTSSEELFYKSQHVFTNKDIQIENLLVDEYLPVSSFFPAQSIGRVDLRSFETRNFTKLSTRSLNLKISPNLLLEDISSEIFILDLQNAYGYINAYGFNQDINAFLEVKDIFKNPSVSISSSIDINMDNLIPSNEFLKIQGKEASQIKLSYTSDKGLKINIFNDLSSSAISSQIDYFNKPKGLSLDTYVEISNLKKPNIFVKNNLFETLVILDNDKLNGYFKSGNFFDNKITALSNVKEFKIFIDIPRLDFEDLNINTSNSNNSFEIGNIAFHFDELLLFGNVFNQQSGNISILGNLTELSLKGNDLNGKISMGDDGFMKVNIEDSKIRSLSFPKNARNDQFVKMRLLGKNVNLDGISLDSFDLYILENKEVITFDDIKISSKIININPLDSNKKAYISFNKKSDLYKVKGVFELNKPTNDIKEYLNYDFDYLKSTMNVEWTSAKELNNLQGKLSFLVKDLKLEQEISNSVLLKALGIFNLRSFFSTIAEIDLSDENRSNLNINRGEGSFVFMKDQARISDPLVIETNFAKMKWIGDIQKDRRNNLSDLDLFLEMRLTISDNLPWYAAFLGGFPAAAGGLVISSIFEDGITDISTLNYQVSGDINNPKLLRLE